MTAIIIILFTLAVLYCFVLWADNERKNMKYADHNSACAFPAIPVKAKDHPLFTAQDKDLHATLSKAYHRLDEGTMNKFWFRAGLYGNYWSFRAFILELKEQLRDAPGEVLKLIGEEGVRKLKNV